MNCVCLSRRHRHPQSCWRGQRRGDASRSPGALGGGAGDGHARARRGPDERGRATSLRRRLRAAVPPARTVRVARRTVVVLAAARTGVFPEWTVRARTVERRDSRADVAAADVWAEVVRADEVRARLAPLSIPAAAAEVRAAVVRGDVAAADVWAEVVRAGVVLPELRAGVAEVRAGVVRVDEVLAGVVRVDEARAPLAPLSITAADVVEVRPGEADVVLAVVRAGVVLVDEVLAGVVLPELRVGVVEVRAGAVRAGVVRDEEARAPLAPRAIAPRAIATRARLGVRRNPRTIRWVKVSALLSASVQKR